MKVLLVDDHVLIRDALRGVLRELTDDAIVLEASDSHPAMRLIEAHPDLRLILLDLNPPDRDGFAALADLRKRYAAISLVVLSASMSAKMSSGHSISARLGSFQNRLHAT
jgi:DNA-binding NarL/FixJ family response regulator